MYVNHINPFKAIVCHYIETTTLICDKNKFISFYMIRDIDLKWVLYFSEESENYSIQKLKGTLMEIWKSPYTFVFI